MGLLNLFLKAELTCIPGVLHRYFGKYYNNTLCNAATWIFLVWCTLHLVFDQFLHSLFKKMKYKSYHRQRLLVSLWYLGFYSSVLFYTGATLFRNDTEFFKLRIGQVPYDVISSQSVIGYVVLLTFLLHSALWESLRNGSAICSASYTLLALFTLFAHYVRVVEIAFSQIAILSIGQVVLNFTKCLDTLTSHMLPNSAALMLSVKCMMFAGILSMVSGYILTVPLIILPFLIRMVTTLPNLLLYLCFCFLLAFLAISLYKSIIYRLVIHWLNHQPTDKGEDEAVCKNILDCILYEPRTDVAYTLSIMQKEAVQRQTAKMPSSRNKLMQTLKCVIAIKKKLHQQREKDSGTKVTSTVSEPENSVEITEITEESVQPGADVIDDAQKCNKAPDSPAIITYDMHKSKCDFKVNLSQSTPTITITDVTDSHELDQEYEESITTVYDPEGSKDSPSVSRDDIPCITITDFSKSTTHKEKDNEDDSDCEENATIPYSQFMPSHLSDSEGDGLNKATTPSDDIESVIPESTDSENESDIPLEANTDPSIATSRNVEDGSSLDSDCDTGKDAVVRTNHNLPLYQQDITSLDDSGLETNSEDIEKNINVPLKYSTEEGSSRSSSNSEDSRQNS